jgi:hypothetical protein
MSSIIKVDQIQLADGSTPTLADLSISTTGTGKVLQVVSATDNTLFENTSTSYADSSLTASITPSSTSSKILIVGAVQIMAYNNGGANAEGYFRIKNSTASTNNAQNFIQIYDYGGSGSISDTVNAMQWLDSPASTSTQTYVVEIQKGSGTAIRVNNGGTSVLTLMEIAG